MSQGIQISSVITFLLLISNVVGNLVEFCPTGAEFCSGNITDLQLALVNNETCATPVCQPPSFAPTTGSGSGPQPVDGIDCFTACADDTSLSVSVECTACERNQTIEAVCIEEKGKISGCSEYFACVSADKFCYSYESLSQVEKSMSEEGGICSQYDCSSIDTGCSSTGVVCDDSNFYDKFSIDSSLDKHLNLPIPQDMPYEGTVISLSWSNQIRQFTIGFNQQCNSTVTSDLMDYFSFSLRHFVSVSCLTIVVDHFDVNRTDDFVIANAATVSICFQEDACDLGEIDDPGTTNAPTTSTGDTSNKDVDSNDNSDTVENNNTGMSSSVTAAISVILIFVFATLIALGVFYVKKRNNLNIHDNNSFDRLSSSSSGSRSGKLMKQKSMSNV